MQTSDNTPQNGKLLEDVCYVQLQLDEGKTSSKYKVRGEFARAGIATENKRVYPQRLWEREIDRLTKALEAARQERHRANTDRGR